MTAPLLQVEGLTKVFGHFLAVKDVSLDLRQGELTALIGPNGAGKTTFYNMISGRLKPTRGVVRFNGGIISGEPPHRISRLGIARSFQITNIFAELSVLENVEVALIARHKLGLKVWQVVRRDEKLRQEALAVLERVDLENRAAEQAGALNYGDKRLLELALVLAIEPRLVLLDEPTAGMTPEETQGVVRLIRRLADSGQYTFFITEHDMSVVFGLAERILVMHHGELLAEGTPAEIRSNREVRTAYLGEED